MKIRHDLHVHTHLSSCSGDPNSTLANYLPVAKANGLTTIGIADHLWDSDISCPIAWYHDQDFAHISSTLEDIKTTPTDGLRVLLGAECEYDYPHRGIAITQEHAEKLDFMIVPNSHTHMTMPKEYYQSHQRHADFMLTAFMDIVTSPLAKYVTAIAHPFSAVACPYDNRCLFDLISDAQYIECFEAAKQANVAIEINTSCFFPMPLNEILEHPSLRMFDLAKKCGCKFTFGSDAHSPSSLADDSMRWANAYVVAQALGLTEEDLADSVR